MTRLAWWLIRAVSWLTPRSLRARWVEEWHAEIEHASAAHGTRRRDRLRVVRMAAGAVPDAIALRRLARHPFHGLTQDVRQAGRALIAAPGFSLGVIDSVTLGIAVNAGAFATINALFFRPVPGVEDSYRVFNIDLCRPAHGGCQGRAFTAQDATARPQVAIVNRPMAERLFDGAAVGRVIRVAARSRYEESLEVRIVGIVEPTIERAYSPRPVPAVYLPAPLHYEAALALYLRSRTSADELIPALRAAVAGVDPRVPIEDVGTLRQRTEERNMEERILASGATMLGAVALLLATSGLCGLFSFIVSLRRREIGVRMALGAEPAAVLRLVWRHAMRLALAGALAGGAIAAVAGALVSAEIYGAPSIDPLVFAGSAAILIVALLAAGFVPAWRAARVDPVVVLRHE